MTKTNSPEIPDSSEWLLKQGAKAIRVIIDAEKEARDQFGIHAAFTRAMGRFEADRIMSEPQFYDSAKKQLYNAGKKLIGTTCSENQTKADNIRNADALADAIKGSGLGIEVLSDD